MNRGIRFIGLLVLALCIASVSAGPAWAEIITLTDLGGPGGYVSSVAEDINDAGQVVGQGDRGQGAETFFWEKGNIIAVALGQSYSPTMINNAGLVAGTSYDVVDGSRRAFVWQAGEGLTYVGPVPAPITWESIACNVNNKGQVLGEWFGDEGWNTFLWKDGQVTVLGYVGSCLINDLGQMAVSAVAATGECHVFLWENGTMTDLGTLGGTECGPGLINNVGQVAGRSNTPSAAYGEYHGFVYNNGTMIDLGLNFEPVGINDAGQVIGYSSTASGEEHAFLWQNGTMNDLGTLGGDWSRPNDINDAGQVVGASATATGDQHAFLWRAEIGMTDLGTFAGGTFSGANKINNTGQVVGGADAACLWTIFSTPPTSNGEIQNIVDVVNYFAALGTIVQGEGEALNASLTAATSQFNAGNTVAACNVLKAFINKVESKMNSGKFGPGEGEPLIAAAQGVSFCQQTY